MWLFLHVSLLLEPDENLMNSKLEHSCQQSNLFCK